MHRKLYRHKTTGGKEMRVEGKQQSKNKKGEENKVKKRKEENIRKEENWWTL